MTYITAIHIPVAALALLPLLLGLPPMLYPMHLVLLELIIDPLCSIVFEAQPSEADAMARPPRNAREPLFGRPEIALAILQGLVLLAGVLTLYVWLNWTGAEPGEARATAFIALVSGHLSLAAAMLAGRRHGFVANGGWIFWIIASAASILLASILLVPVLREIMRFALPPAGELLGGIVVGLAAGGWYGARLMIPRRSMATPFATSR
jgi:Ca2+-transporting ATPase